MVRTQIYLEDEQILKLNLASEKLNVKKSELIRLAIDEYFSKKDKDVKWEDDPLDKSIGSIELNVEDASVNHDKYLYGNHNE